MQYRPTAHLARVCEDSWIGFWGWVDLGFHCDAYWETAIAHYSINTLKINTLAD